MIAVEMRHITKSFGSLRANDDVSLRVAAGEIHALIGENGAGKTTLMKVLYGIHMPDRGEIEVRGNRIAVDSPAVAIRHGIGMVHQHFMLVSPFTVLENIILGQEPRRWLVRLDRKAAREQVRHLSDAYHLEVDPDAPIESLSVGEQQRVEILKLLYRSADILILDEPTPVLTPQEIEGLFVTLAGLKHEGKTVILITHKLSEVMAISDTVTVMRQGKVVGSVETASTDPAALAELMVGRQVGGQKVRTSIPASGEPVLVVDRITVLSDRGIPAVRSVSLKVSPGEILGIAGVEGNGQSELVEATAGLRRTTEGSITIGRASSDPSTVRPAVAHIPEDRLRRGLILEFSIAENLLLGRQAENRYGNLLHLKKDAIGKEASEMIKTYDVRPPSAELIARRLSGGNQQKVIIARELSKHASLIIANQPTRGLDISAIEFVHAQLMAQRNAGKAILLVSSDLEELLALCDRIAVMFGGEIVGLFSAKETSERELGFYMTGAKRKTA